MDPVGAPMMVAPLPPGVKPDHSRFPGNSIVLLIVGSVAVLTMLAFLSVRLYTKFKIMNKRNTDDCGT